MGEKGEDENFLRNNNKSMPEVKSRGFRDQCNWITWILLLLNLLLLGISLTVVVVWRTRTTTHVTTPTAALRDNLCLPCADISLHQDDDVGTDFTIKQTDDGSELCCADGGRHLDRLIKMFVERRYREDKANHRFCQGGWSVDSTKQQSEKPASRVVGLADMNSNFDDRTIRWDLTSDKSFKQSGIEFLNNSRFFIPSSGYYYVYSQVTLKEEDGGATNNNVGVDSLINHAVFRENDGTKEKLLENFESRCKLQTKQSNATSYVGAVFRLREKDELYVTLSHPERINQSPHGNYFGVHLI
ncbi:hypothetical protein ScPMuIL_018331 [Solemya velum]